MTAAWGEASLLVELLDRQFHYLLTLQGTSRLARLSHVLLFLVDDSRTAGLLDDFRLEAFRVRRAYGSVDRAIRRSLVQLWNNHRTEIESLLGNVTNAASDPFGGLDDYADPLRTPRSVQFSKFGAPTERECQTERAIDALSHWTKCVIDCAAAGGVQPTDGLRSIQPELAHLSCLFRFASRRFQESCKTLPWLAYRRLARHAKATNPKPPTSRDQAAWIEFEVRRTLAENLFRHEVTGGILPASDKIDVEAVYATVDSDAKLLHEELRHRIGLGRSRLAVVERYAAKCEGFDARELRELCARNSRNAERYLTLHFARYVFDQGLFPLIDPTVGGLRPDVLHVGVGDALFVEAKQYGGQHPRTAIEQAYVQVWSTWARVRKLWPVSEAFLIVFRRAGPLVELPPKIRYDGRTLYSILADISTEGGSAETGQVVRIARSDLLPPSGGVEEKRRAERGEEGEEVR